MYEYVGPPNWKKITVYDLAHWKNGLAFRNINFSNSGKPVIKIAELKSGITEQTKFTKDEYDEEVFVQEGDMLFAWSGSPETSIDVFRWKGPDGWLNQHIYKITPQDNVNESFLFFLLRWLRPRFVEIAKNKQTTGLGHVTLQDFKNMVVGLPPEFEQRAIVSFVAPIQEQIDLNRRMNKTLEAMARALFKDWFIDFGPTRAKMQGRKPYLAPDIWNLFPDSLDAEGKPEGWKKFRLEQVANHHKQTISPSSTHETVFEHFSIPAFDKGQTPVFELGANIKSNKAIVPDQSVLLSKLNPDIPRTWLPNGAKQHQQIASTEFLPFTAKQIFGRHLLFCLLSNDKFRKILQSMVTGTSKSHQRVPYHSLLKREVISGATDIFCGFETLVTPLLERIGINRTESRTLAQTHDLLLPKLMSGKISIRDAGKTA